MDAKSFIKKENEYQDLQQADTQEINAPQLEQNIWQNQQQNANIAVEAEENDIVIGQFEYIEDYAPEAELNEVVIGQFEYIEDYAPEGEKEESELRKRSKKVNELRQAREAINSYHISLEKLYKSGMLSIDQLMSRVDAGLQIWRELTSAERNLLERDPGFIKDYQEARELLLDFKKDLESENQKAEISLYKHLIEIGKEEEILPVREEKEPVSDDLCEADRWLLLENMKTDEQMENSVVFHLLNRPAEERLLAYYLIEKGYSKDLSDVDILLFNDQEYQMKFNKGVYEPNVEALRRSGFRLSDLKRVYHQVCEAGPRMESMNRMQQAMKSMELEDVNADIVTKIQKIKDSLGVLKERKSNYDKGNCFRKLCLKSKVSEAVTDLYQNMNDFLNIKIHVQGNEKISNVMDYVTDILLTGNGVKTFASATTVGFNVMQWKKAVNITNIGVNGLGALLGGVNLLLAGVGMMKTLKGFTKLTKASQFGTSVDLLNQFLSSSSSVTSSVLGTMSAVNNLANTASQTLATATVHTAGLGVLVGGIGAAVGGYKLTNAFVQGENAKRAKRELDQSRKLLHAEEENQKEHVNVSRQLVPRSQILTENNIFKIQERINERTKVSAGCQTASAICAIGASACLVLQQPLGGLMMGALGLLMAAGGAIATQIMKRRGYEKAVDEYLDLERLAEAQYREAEKKSKRYLRDSEKKKIKNRLRIEMMEMLGFTTVKSFYIHIIKNYAGYIYRILRPAVVEAEQNHTVLSKEAAAFKILIESLGLKCRYKADTGAFLPSVEMIFAKLMS